MVSLHYVSFLFRYVSILLHSSSFLLPLFTTSPSLPRHSLLRFLTLFSVLVYLFCFLLPLPFAPSVLQPLSPFPSSSFSLLFMYLLSFHAPLCSYLFCHCALLTLTLRFTSPLSSLWCFFLFFLLYFFSFLSSPPPLILTFL